MTELDPTVFGKFKDALNTVIEQSKDVIPTEHPATVMAKDEDGTVWVRLFGSDTDTPVSSTTSTVDVGDNVEVVISEGRAKILRNRSTPAAGVSFVARAFGQAVEDAEAYSDGRFSLASKANAITKQIAEEAEAIATAVNQHFFDDDQGIHVTDVTQDEWEASYPDFSDQSTTKPYNNILVNSAGILLRAALKNLVSITKTAIAFYDGNGNAASNITASFGSSGAIIGYAADYNTVVNSNGFSINKGTTTDLFDITTSTLYDRLRTQVHLAGTDTELYAVKLYGTSWGDPKVFNIKNGPGQIQISNEGTNGKTSSVMFVDGNIEVFNGQTGKETTFNNDGSVSFDGAISGTSATFSDTVQQQRSGNMNWSEKDLGVNLTLANNGLSSGTRYMEWLSYDKNGLIPGGVSNEVASDGTVRTRLRCRNYDTSGNAYDNPLVLAVTKAGGRSASLGGDLTLTNSGRLYMKHATVDTAESNNNVSGTTYLAYGVHDRDDRFYQYTQAVAYSDGATRAQFAARNNVNGSNVDNIIYLDVSANGELSVTLSENARASWLQQVMKGKTILYNNAAGSATSVTLSATAANFNHMRIYYSSNTAANALSYANGGVASVDVYSPNGKYVDLVGAHRISDTCVQLRVSTAYISGTTITLNQQGMYANINNGTTADSVGKEAKTYVFRVEAWNE